MTSGDTEHDTPAQNRPAQVGNGPGGKTSTGAPAASGSPLPVGVECPDCGYDLRGLTGERCPECGFGLDVLRDQKSRIPWSHRAALGSFRAYWKTVWLATRWPKHLWMEMAREVSYADSQSFRWLTCLHAYLPILLGMALWCLMVGARQGTGAQGDWWIAGGLQVVALGLLAGLPGLASYFFHPRRELVIRQNRAIALSYYASAPLAWTVLFVPVAVVGAPLTAGRTPLGTDVLVGILAVAYLTAIVMWQARFMVLLGMLHRSRIARLVRLALLNVLALGLLLLVLLIPCSFFYLLVIYHSLR